MRRVILCLIFCFISSVFAGPSSSQKKKDLERYNQKIREQQDRLKHTIQKAGSLHLELRRIAESVDQLDRDISSLEKEEKALNQKIEGAGEEIQETEKKVSLNQQDVARHFRNLYKRAELNPMRVILASESFADLRSQEHYVKRWVNVDLNAISYHRSQAEKLVHYRKILQKNRSEKEALAKKLESKRGELSREKSDRSQLLAMVENQKDFYEKNIHELEQSAKDLQTLLETLQKSSFGDSAFERMKGKLIWPVLGGKIEKKFGAFTDSKLNTKLYHKGIDFRISEGTEIRAVFDGKVVYSGWFSGYGKILIVDHGAGYFTLYAHAKELVKKENETVSAGEKIASVGDTESLKGSYLYFELRNKGISQDPYPWFAARK